MQLLRLCVLWLFVGFRGPTRGPTAPVSSRVAAASPARDPSVEPYSNLAKTLFSGQPYRMALSDACSSRNAFEDSCNEYAHRMGIGKGNCKGVVESMCKIMIAQTPPIWSLSQCQRGILSHCSSGLRLTADIMGYMQHEHPDVDGIRAMNVGQFCNGLICVLESLRNQSCHGQFLMLYSAKLLEPAKVVCISQSKHHEIVERLVDAAGSWKGTKAAKAGASGLHRKKASIALAIGGLTLLWYLEIQV